MQTWEQLPADLPVPPDDGACRHLPGSELPPLRLPSTAGGEVDLAEAGRGLLVLYIYPMTGRPGEPLPVGWDATPGARGCTPQSCAFRDHYAEIRALGAEVLALSSQSPAYQGEMARRLHLPFAVLSDGEFRLAAALGLPRFELAGRTFYKRVTLIVRGGRIEHVFYPVFPPDKNADAVIQYLRQHRVPPGSA